MNFLKKKKVGIQKQLTESNIFPSMYLTIHWYWLWAWVLMEPYPQIEGEQDLSKALGATCRSCCV